MSLLIKLQLANALLKIQRHEQAENNREHDITAHQEYITKLEEELPVKKKRIAELELDLLNKTCEVDGISSELSKRNKEIQKLEFELERCRTGGRLRIVTSHRPSPAFDPASLSDHGSGDAELPYQGSVSQSQDDLSSVIGPILRGTHCVVEGDISVEHGRSLADELGERWGYDSNDAEEHEMYTANYPVEGSTVTAYGNEAGDDVYPGENNAPVLGNLALQWNYDSVGTVNQGQTCSRSPNGNYFHPINGQESSDASDLKASACQLNATDDSETATLHVSTHQIAHIDDGISPNSHIAMVRDAMADDNEMNSQYVLTLAFAYWRRLTNSSDYRMALVIFKKHVVGIISLT
jgi:hypothetical protein